MNDWATVAIAFISAGAGLGGVVLQSLFARKSQEQAQHREDAALVRQKLEDLHRELDRLEALANQNSSEALGALHAKITPPQPLARLDLGVTRSLVNLYFKECVPAIDTYDQKVASAGTHMRGQLEKGVDPLPAVMSIVLITTAGINSLCAEMRKSLAQVAARIGAPTS